MRLRGLTSKMSPSWVKKIYINTKSGWRLSLFRFCWEFSAIWSLKSNNSSFSYNKYRHLYHKHYHNLANASFFWGTVFMSIAQEVASDMYGSLFPPHSHHNSELLFFSSENYRNCEIQANNSEKKKRELWDVNS